MRRRRLLAIAGGVGTGGVLVGYTKSSEIVSVFVDSLEHEIRIRNNRETGHDVRLVVEFDTESSEFGPHRLSPEETWEVTRVSSYDEATLKLYVDERHVWTDTHELPDPDASGQLSRFVISLDPEGEISSSHWIDD